MRFTRPGISEAALAAHFEYLCTMSGAQRMAYVPVVASGYVIHDIFWSLSEYPFEPTAQTPLSYTIRQIIT